MTLVISGTNCLLASGMPIGALHGLEGASDVIGSIVGAGSSKMIASRLDQFEGGLDPFRARHCRLFFFQ